MAGKHNPKRRIAVICPDCLSKSQANMPALLDAAARALTACRDAGIELRVRHGALTCPEGLILQLDDGSFVSRTRIYTPFSEPGDIDDLGRNDD